MTDSLRTQLDKSGSARLAELFDSFGQSPWIDNLTRDMVRSGDLAALIDLGIRGLTSNPSIFQKAMTSSSSYDDDWAELRNAGRSATEAYWELVVADIASALDAFGSLGRATGGRDGNVSVEVAPDLAHDTAATVAAALDLHARVEAVHGSAAPHLLIKVPATRAGIPAIRELLTRGISVNITLIFGLERYADVIDAYIGALSERHARGERVDNISSVASFFVSRVDTEVDRRLNELGHPDLAGRAAVAQAQAAYALFVERFAGAEWDSLAAAGAVPQRPLWASTSTKNPAYPDTLYVDSLIGPHTVNTLPDATVAAFADHGTLARTVDADPAAARATLGELEAAGIDFADVADVLENEGVAAFQKSFTDLLAALSAK